MPYFTYRGQRISYTVHGSGPRTAVLIHGLLANQRMYQPLAQSLADSGFQAVTIDLLGHGESEHPRSMWRYTVPFFAEQVVAMLDHLEIPQTVTIGASLGANTALQIAAGAPERLRGMVLEMPVLDNGLVSFGAIFTPLLAALKTGGPAIKLAQKTLELAPSTGVPFWIDVLIDALKQDPAAAAAVIQGIAFGPTAPSRGQRRTFTTPSLVIGHHKDPIHPFSDAGMLTNELPNARLLEARSVLELRLMPKRLTEEIIAFTGECWSS